MTATRSDWPMRLFILLCVLQNHACFHFFPKDTFLGKPILESEIETMSIAGGNRFDAAVSGVGRSRIETLVQSAPVLHRRSIHTECFDVEEGEDSEVYTVKDSPECTSISINKILSGTGKTLEELTAEYFNGETYKITEYQMVEGVLALVIGEADVPVVLFDKFSLGSEDAPSKIAVTLAGDELSYESVGIKVIGTVRLRVKSKTLPYDIETEIEKEEESDTYGITKFDLAGQSVAWAELMDENAALFQMDQVDIASKIGSTLEGFTGFGAFNAEKDFQFGITAEGEIINKIAGAKKLTFLYSQNHLKASADITGFVQFDEETQLMKGLTYVLGNTAGIDDSFLLNKVNSEKWCISIVSGDTTYMDPVKSHLEECIGVEKDELLKGVYFYVELNIKEFLVECGNSEADLGEETTVAVYAGVSSAGVQITLPNGFAVPLQALLKCGGVATEKLPDVLSKTSVKLTEVDMNAAEKLLKLGIEVELSDEFNRIPGTSIRIKKFSLTAERKIKEEEEKGEARRRHNAVQEKRQDTPQGDFYWDISASGEIQLGDATFEITLEKSEGEYKLGLTVDHLTLFDILNTFNSGGGDNEVLQKDIFKTLGIKDFSVEWSFGGGASNLDIRGTPVIFEFDNLHFHAIIQTGSPEADAKRRSTLAKHPGIVTSQQHRRTKRAIDLQFAFAIFLDGANFDSIIERFTGNPSNLCWLSNLKAIVVVSTTNGVVKGPGGEEEEEQEKKKARKSKLTLPILGKKHGANVSPHNEKPVKQKKQSISTDGTKGNKNDQQRRAIGVQQQKVSKGMRRDGEEEEEEEEAEGEEDEGIELSFPTLPDDFTDTEFEQGFMFAISWRIPGEKAACGGNGFCTWMVENLGPSFIFTLSGSVGSGGIKLRGEAEGHAVLKKDEGKSELAFTRLALAIEVPSISIEAELQYKDKSLGAWDRPLIFTGVIEASPTEVSLTFSMENFIYPTPITEYIAIGNILLGMGYTFGAPLPSLSFGAALKLGKLDPNTENEQAIAIAGYFGIDPGNAGNNWFYASVSVLTLDQVCIAFELSCDGISPAFRESGFPEGITASFSAEEREEAPIGTIPEGLDIKGAINFLGFECRFHLTITTSEFGLELEMTPIAWAGGMIAIQRTEDDAENGPMADIKFGTDGTFNIRIVGSCNFLNIIKASADVTINDEEIDIKIKGSLIPAILDLEIQVQSKYNEDEFSFVGTLSSNTDFTEKIKKALNDFLMMIKEKVTAVFARVERALQSAKADLAKANGKVQAWQNKIAAWKASLVRRREQLKREASATPPCNCPDVCFGFLRWHHSCWKIWGKSIGCLKWDSCFRMIKNIFCYTKCYAKKAVSAIVRFAKTAINEITILVANTAGALGDVAKGVLSLANGILDVAQGAVNLVKKGLNWVLDGIQKALNWILDNFRLNHFTVSASLSGTVACVGFDLSVVFGKEINAAGNLCLDMDNPLKSLVLALLSGNDAPAELKSDGKSMSDKVNEVADEANGELEEVDNSHVKLNSEITSTEGEVNKETNKDFASPSKRHLNEQDSYNPTEDPEVLMFVENAPWKVLDDHRLPLGINSTYTDDHDSQAEKRTLNFDHDMSPCAKMKRALNGYAELTDGLVHHGRFLKRGATLLVKAQNAEQEKMRKVRNYIENMVRERNGTETQRNNAFYVYQHVKEGYEALSRKSKIIIRREETSALPIIRRQLNNLLGKEKQQTFMQYTEHMHQNAVEGYKRSLIPHQDDAKGEQLLESIKTDLQSIVTDEKRGLTSMTDRLKKVQRNIISMRTYTQRCD